MKKIIATLALIAPLTQAADIVLAARGSSDNIITQDAYPSMKFPETTITQTTLSMLAMNLSQKGKSIALTDEAMALSLQQQGLWIDSDTQGCQVALELHFDPKHAPKGEGNGLWIAADEQGQALAQAVLTDFASHKGRIYWDKPISGIKPEIAVDCPVLHINLDTNVQAGDHLWFIQPQAILNYSRKLSDAVLKALES